MEAQPALTRTGEPVILLHSSGASGRQWKRLAAVLAEAGKRPIVPDLTGHGASPPWPADESFHFQRDVDAIVALVDAESDPVHLVGHSYGGLIALHTALARPAKTRSLAVYDPVALGALDPTRDHDIVDALDDIGQRWREMSDEAWLESFVNFWGGPGAWSALRPEVRAEFQRTVHVVRAGVRTLGQDTTPASAYRALSCPTRLLTGEHSPAAAQRIIDRLSEAIPGGRAVRIPGAGHFGPITHAAATHQAILDLDSAP